MDYTKEKQKITDLVHSALYHELYDYISLTFDARPSTTVKVIETLPDVIESMVNETEKSKQCTITTGDQLSPIPEDFGPVPKTIDVLY